MRVALKPHPDTPSRAVEAIDVEIWRTRSGGLVAKYCARGDISKLERPPFAGHDRADELWKHTCFELFARRPGAGSYLELNFSPSMQWAAYRFGGYREGMEADLRISPQLEARYGAEFYELRAYIPAEQIEGVALTPPWQVAISAVIEETDRAKSYWALAHPPGKPDFHHADSFALELP